MRSRTKHGSLETPHISFVSRARGTSKGQRCRKATRTVMEWKPGEGKVFRKEPSLGSDIAEGASRIITDRYLLGRSPRNTDERQ